EEAVHLAPPRARSEEEEELAHVIIAGGEELPLGVGLVEGAEDLLEERGGGDGAAHLGALGHVAREEVELVERRGVIDRAVALHALIRAALPSLLGGAALAARALAGRARHGAVCVPLGAYDQPTRPERL